MTEEWRPIAGLEGYYEVSSLGIIRGIARDVPVPASRRCAAYIRHVPAREIRPGLTTWGYPYVYLSQLNVKTQNLVAHLVALAFLGATPPERTLSYRNGDRRDCRLANLFFATRSEVEDVRRIRGTHVSGERDVWAKLTEVDVRHIRANPERLSQMALAEIYGVHQTNISLILRGKRWKDVA